MVYELLSARRGRDRKSPIAKANNIGIKGRGLDTEVRGRVYIF